MAHGTRVLANEKRTVFRRNEAVARQLALDHAATRQFEAYVHAPLAERTHFMNGNGPLRRHYFA